MIIGGKEESNEVGTARTAGAEPGAVAPQHQEYLDDPDGPLAAADSDGGALKDSVELEERSELKTSVSKGDNK